MKYVKMFPCYRRYERKQKKIKNIFSIGCPIVKRSKHKNAISQKTYLQNWQNLCLKSRKSCEKKDKKIKKRNFSDLGYLLNFWDTLFLLKFFKLLSVGHFCTNLNKIWHVGLIYVNDWLYFPSALFGCQIRAAERQPATIWHPKP